MHLWVLEVVSSTIVTCSGWEERPCVPGVRMLRTEARWGPGCALPHAATAQGSVRLSIQVQSILWAGGCTELPGGGCSAHGEDARWQHLLILSSGSHHGDGRHRTSTEGRGVSLAPEGFVPSFQESTEAEDNSSPGWKDLTGLSTLTFSSSSSSRQRCQRPPAPGALRERCSS